MFHVKQFRAYYTNPYKVSDDVRDEVSEIRTSCDAYTVVSADDYLARLLASKWAKYADFAQKAGNKVKPYKAHRYEGFQVGSMRYAIIPNRTDSLLGVTGELAGHTYEEMLSYDLRATRVDLAVTVFFNTPLPDYAAQMYDARVMRGDLWKGDIKHWKLIQGKTGSTLYVGQRGTGKYIRLYDKSMVYSGTGELGWVWRFECEYGIGYADTLWQQLRTELDNERDLEAYMIKRLWGDLYNKGIALPVAVEALPSGERRKDKAVTTKDRYLTWLNKTVRPAVQWLIAMGYGEEVSEALQLQQSYMDILEQDELLKATISLISPEDKPTL